MCYQCNLEMPEQNKILKWLESYPILSQERAGIAGKIGSLIKDELIAAWAKDAGFDAQLACFDLQCVQCILQGFQQAMQPLMQMQQEQQARAQQEFAASCQQ